MEALSAFLLPLFLLTLQLTSLTRLRSQAQNLPNEEGEALREIARKLEVRDLDVNKNACNGGWMKAANSRDVRNVICDCSYNSSTICHVKIFVFKGQNLTGILPEELADLPFLEYIDLSRNYLIGSIPARWATLRHLSNLSIMGNRINGTIPKEFGSITTLTELIVEDNQLKGPLPPELGNLSRLESFVASGNQIAGPLPPTFGSLTSLNQFLIDGNSIFGKIPEFIGNWTRITRLDMQGTSMEGPIPSTISNLRNLTELRISDLIIPSVGFPPLHTMPNMRKLVLRNCLTSTEIPEFIGNNMKNLLSLDLSFNNLTGKIPNNFEALSIDHMYLSNNMLTGDIPDWILNSTRQLDISNNNFTGPPSLTNCQRGNVNLVASYSSTGNSSVASCFRKDFPCPKKPQYYSLFINCGGKKLMINKQEYEDDSLDLGPSTFYSTERWAYSSTGDFMDIRNKSYIETNTSVLTTRNPYLYMTARVAPLSLTYYGFCLQNGNYKVQLHFAEIVFTADQTYTSNGRRVFDVLIQGKRLLKDFNIEDEAGGPGRETIQTFYIDVTSNTLEIQLYWAGKGTQAIPYHGVYGPLISAISVTPNFKPDTGDNWLSIGAIIGITVASFASTVLIFIFIWLKGFLGTKNFIDKELRNLELQTGYFSLKQIKVATNNFHPSNKIGEGGFGPVYKGILSDGTEIAVKQLSSTSKQGNREFINEIGMISALQHPNLVKLFGCCVEGDQLLVVYEYMENNSLAHALFGREKHRLKLDWPTRRNICLQIARGLAYLHEESRLKIVHRDIKATNILLDEDLNAKISDFGLAKLDEDENSHISTRIAGTIGYMAPEYAMRGYLTDKADVYSFGVVMLEIISGKSNTTYRSSLDLIYLLDWAYVLQEQGTLLELVDPNLGLDYSEEEAKRMLNLALLCTNASPALRPAMSAVVKMLKGEIELQPSLVKHNSVRDDRSEGFEEYPQESQTKSRSMDWSLLYCSSVSQQNRGGAHFSSSKRLLDDSYTAPKSVSIG